MPRLYLSLLPTNREGYIYFARQHKAKRPEAISLPGVGYEELKTDY